MSADPKPPLPARETEPTAGSARGPIWLVVLLVVLFYWGTLYIHENSGEFQAAVFRPYRSMEELAALHPKSKADEFFVQGKRLYDQYCSSCHQAAGTGSTVNNCPPLAGSEWVLAAGPGRLARIVLDGGQGPITVKGQLWNNGTMTPFREVVTSDADIAAILTFIRGNKEWGNNASLVTSEQVKAVREKTADHGPYWNAAELLGVSETE
ncbi:MAG: cytochrome c [Verrucomicrobia bacterium]|nr:cytochrome c [Verrucomicrobiota bacterium]